MKKQINELWKCMPLFETMYPDSFFDNDYVFKGFTFILSIIFLPLTLPAYLIGRMFK